MNIRQALASLLVMLCVASGAMAQNHQAYIIGNIVDSFSYHHLTKDDSVSITLMRADSAVVRTVEAEFGEGDLGGSVCVFNLHVTKDMGSEFILKLTSPHYHTTYKHVAINWQGTKRLMAYVQIGQIPMRRLPRSQTLSEATVTATKVKFYLRGDTLVYNADAFQLQEGSMLDALIAQLPGAELSADGRITVNGRFVESLLLNGRDFFKGDNTVLLDNLPAYMVKEVQVYEKMSPLSEAVGEKVDEGQYVMDVKLKRQYEIGWLANAELGGGTEKRYLGRLFAMRYTPQSNITFFASMNNVNDRRKPDGRGGWGDFDPTGGLTATKRAGMSYGVFDKKNRFQVSGNADVNYTDNDYVRGGTTTELLDGGGVYNYLTNATFGDNLSVSTQHHFRYRYPISGISLSITPAFTYNRSRSQGEAWTGTFSSPLDMNYLAVIDSLRSMEWSKAALNLIKRNTESSRSKGESKNLQTRLWASFPIGHVGRNISFDAFIRHTARKDRTFDHYTLSFWQGSDLTSDNRNRYYNNPESETEVTLTSNFLWRWSQTLFVKPSYEFAYRRFEGDELHYRLDRLQPQADEQPLGWLPSEANDLLRALDETNSYTARQDAYYHQFRVVWQWNIPENEKHGKWFIQLGPSLHVRRYDFSFIPRYDPSYFIFTNTPQPQTQNVDKTYVLPELNFTAENTTRGGKHFWRWRASLTTAAPSPSDLIDHTYTNDPLNITIGNPNLKSNQTFTTTLNYQPRAMNRKQRNLWALVGYTYRRNAEAMSYTYDRATGVRTSQKRNVNGNYVVWLNGGYNMPLDRQQRITLSTTTNTAFYHDVDYATSNLDLLPTRTTTQRFLLNQQLSLTYRYGKVSAGAKAGLAYNHTNSSLADVDRLNTWNINYGLNAVVDLPLHFQLSSELSMLTRRGYENTYMNETDLVWNARLSKSVMNSRLTFMLDAWDILGNLSNITVGGNSTTHWEYTYNVIPRYVMLRLVYRLDLQPKKK